jgi:hypothetical protein
MVLAVGEENEAAWLRSLNFYTPWNQKERLQSQCNSEFEIKSSDSGIRNQHAATVI